MPHTDYCAYPPRLAADAEIVPLNESQKPSYIAGSESVGRYLILGAMERRLLHLLDGSHSLDEVAHGLPGLNVTELSRFLTKLDEVGLLAGVRSVIPRQRMLPGAEYWRWRLFNPEALFNRMLAGLGWIWTPGFFALSAAMVAFAAILAVLDRAEFVRYAGLALRSHYAAILLAAWVVTAVHECSHGLTSKAFGGRATELGFLLIYYVLPGFYCDVTGIHRIPSRARRLWVIAAGIYSQLLLGSGAMLVWSVFAPDTWISQTAMAVILASLLDLLINVNPLIKLDGYYFLSQWLRMPNLMDRSQACWRDVGRTLLIGVKPREAVRFTGRERKVLLVFGCFSFTYRAGLRAAIVWYGAQYLMNWFQYSGLLLSVALAGALAGKPLKQSAKFWFGKENRMAAAIEAKYAWRRFVPAGVAVLILAALLMPWTASVGSYGTLVALPERESVIRAPENASLVVLSAQPGQQVAAGACVGQMANLDMEEQIARVRTELASVEVESERLSGERAVQEEAAMSAEWQLVQRRREFRDVDGEAEQIEKRYQNGRPGGGRFVAAALSEPAVLPPLPPALAAMEAETGRLQAELTEAKRRWVRARALSNEGLLPRSELDIAERRAASFSSEVAAAEDKLNAALIDHERRHASTQTEVNVARANVSTATARASSLTLQIEAARRLRESLAGRLAVLERKRAQFAISSPRNGTLFGEDLPRMLGQYFAKGAEICRVADVHEILVRVQVGEEALSDVRLGQNVRVKTRTFPDRVFRGTVSKIGGEGEASENGHRTYRLEFTIQNEDGLLRPGMTVFTRADYGRRPVMWLLAHKMKQALRPEMWML